MGIFSDLRLLATLSGSLRRIADELTTIRIQLNFKSLSDLRAEEKLAASEVAEREHRDALGRPLPEDTPLTETQIAFDQLRERLAKGEYVDDTELIAASHELAIMAGTDESAGSEY